MLCQKASSPEKKGSHLHSLCSNDSNFLRHCQGLGWDMDNPKRIAIHMYTEKKPKEEKEEEEKGEEKGNAEIEKSVFPFC